MAKGGAAPSPAAAPAAKAAKAKAADSASSSSSSAADSSAASSSPPGIARSNTLESDRPTAYSGAELPKMREAVREKMRQVLMTDYDGPPLYDVAEATEAAIEALSRGDSKAYGDKFRQLAFNLKKNAPLRYSVNRQETTPEALVSMAPKDLATQEKKKAMEEMAQFEHDKRSLDWNSKNDHKIREEMGLGKIVGMYSCGRCKSLKIKNSEAQTRSADEPMTQVAHHVLWCLVLLLSFHPPPPPPHQPPISTPPLPVLHVPRLRQPMAFLSVHRERLLTAAYSRWWGGHEYDFPGASW